MDEARLWDTMNAAWDRMSFAQRRLWEAIRIAPERWRQEPYGKATGGFWVVGIIGRRVVWFNDLEDGFELSSYEQHGLISEYGSNGFTLEMAAQYLLSELETGYRTAPRSSAPIPGEYNS